MAALSSGNNLASSGCVQMFNEELFHVVTVSSYHFLLRQPGRSTSTLSLMQLLSTFVPRKRRKITVIFALSRNAFSYYQAQQMVLGETTLQSVSLVLI